MSRQDLARLPYAIPAGRAGKESRCRCCPLNKGKELTRLREMQGHLAQLGSQAAIDTIVATMYINVSTKVVQDFLQQ